MKKSVTVAAVVVGMLLLVTGLTGPVAAGTLNYDVEIFGEYELDYVYEDKDFVDNDDDESSYLEHELDLGFSISVLDNVSIVGEMEYADNTLGEGDHAIGQDNNIDVEAAYVEMAFEPVTITGGKFSFSFPHAFDDSPLLDDEITGVALDFDMVSVGWLRADDFSEMTEDKRDIFYVKGDMEAGGARIRPYLAYENQGENAAGVGSGIDAAFTTYWLGVALEMEAGALGLGADFIYGDRSFSDDTFGIDQSGMMVDFIAELDTGSITPSVFAVYSTGEDDDFAESEWMPIISSDLEPFNIIEDELWEGIILFGGGISDITTLPKLEHELLAFYAEGTNDAGLGLFSDEDNVCEIDFNSSYELLENCELYSELGYAVADIDGLDNEEDAISVEIGMEIEF